MAPLVVGAYLGGGRMGRVEVLEAFRADLLPGGSGSVFDPATLIGLPEPARRYLLRAISPGAPIARAVELEMRGEIRLKPAGDPLPIHAVQLLAPPEGFVWSARAGRGIVRITGYDRYVRGAGEMRWSLWGVIRVMRATGEGVTRSAAGRLAMEAVLQPSALLPGGGVTREGVDDTKARFRMRVGSEDVAVTLEVAPDGRPTRVSAMRWQDETHRYESFVVELGGELASGGYRIPSEVTAGWRLGEANEFRFYQATLEQAEFR